MGRIDIRKGVELLLKEFTLFNDGKYELLIAGEGKKYYVENLKKRYNKNIKYLGFVNKKKFLCEIDILVIPSLWNEPLTRVILESYSYGVCVIATSTGGTPEIVDDGKTGFLFNPGDKKRFKEIVERIIDYPMLVDDFRINCLNKAKGFSLNNHLDEYVDLYESVI